MGTSIFLGEPTAKVKEWLISHIPLPPPKPIAESQDGAVKIMSMVDRTTGSSSQFVYNHIWDIDGEGFIDSIPGWQIDSILLFIEPGSEPIGLDFEVKSSTKIEISGSVACLPAGSYGKARLYFGLVRVDGQGIHYNDGMDLQFCLDVPEQSEDA